MNFGITVTGFNRKRVEDIRSELQTDFKTAFGDNIDVSEQSNFGALIDMLTKRFATLWEGQEEQYNSKDVNSNFGVSLQRSCQMVGVAKLAETFTSLQAILKGDNGTVVSSGSLVSQDVTAEELSLNDNVTISVGDAIESLISVQTVTDSIAYIITINSIPYSINSGVGATAIGIMAALKVEVDGGTEPVIFTDNLDGSCLIQSDDGVTAFIVSVSAELQIDQTGTLGQFTATTPGSVAIPANTVNTIVTPVSGWDVVENTQAGITGSDEEADEELRIRRRTALLGVGAGTDSAIEANIYNEVANVTSVRVFSNRTNGTVDLRPAKSFEAIVTGGSDQLVADKIWEVQPSGIESYGNQTETVIDSNGDSQTIKFSRPADRYIWIKYTLELYSEESFPATGEAAIKDSVVAFALEQYLPGVDVIRDRLTQPVYEAVPGVGNMTIELAVTTLPTDTPSYGTSNIAITDREIAQVITERITVLVP